MKEWRRGENRAVKPLEKDRMRARMMWMPAKPIKVRSKAISQASAPATRAARISRPPSPIQAGCLSLSIMPVPPSCPFLRCPAKQPVGHDQQDQDQQAKDEGIAVGAVFTGQQAHHQDLGHPQQIAAEHVTGQAADT